MQHRRLLSALPFYLVSLLSSCAGRFHLDADGLRVDIYGTEIQRQIDKKGDSRFTGAYRRWARSGLRRPSSS
jgi:hypothetical protein